jgi:hypothetical protein
VYHNTKRRSSNHGCRGQTISITYSDCVFVAFFIQHAKRISRIRLSPVAFPSLLYVSTVFHTRFYFREKKIIEHIMGVLFFSTTQCQTFLIIRRTERDMIKKVH